MAATLKTTVIQEPSSSTVNLTLGSTGGVTFGAAATTNTITSAAATALTIQSAGTTAMTIDTSQNVGIGTTSPSTKLTATATVNGAGDAYGIIQAYNTNTNATDSASLTVKNYSGTGQFMQWQNVGLRIGSRVLTNTGAGNVVFTYGADAEGMRIDTSGNLLVGTTTSIGGKIASTTNGGFSPVGSDNWKKGAFSSYGGFGGPLSFINSAASDGFCFYLTNTPSQLNIQFGANGGGLSYGVYLTSTGTSWTASSDERLKDISGTITNAVQSVSSLRPIRYTFKADESKTQRVGLIAQDVQKVLPEVVDENADGYFGVRYAEVIPLLVAAIQELSAKVDAQAAEITALQAKVGA